ncbi:MAG: putative endoribonuklease [Conexibacter sp.]|jgi:2-iminobutanoate/2-iminopropanoate deaminase|nr:putative endoribonuklease [Conexibacter sp.]
MRLIDIPDGPPLGGPYSLATVLGETVYCSGQIGLDAATGALVTGGFEDEVRRAFANVTEVLEHAGSSLASVLHVRIYLVDLARFAELNEIYVSLLGDHRPARTTIGVADLPLGASVEVECVAALIHGSAALEQ